VRIVGKPNAGKSQLFNALLGEQRALVSPSAGTTGDTVGALMLIRGVPVRLQDTAGADNVESACRDARIIVHLLTDVADSGLKLAPTSPTVITGLGRADERIAVGSIPAVSGLTGQGLADLRDRLADALGIPKCDDQDVWAPVDPELRSLFRVALEVADRSSTD